MLSSETIKLGNGRQVQIHRTGVGPTVVWLHGPHGVRRNDPVIEALSRHYTVIAPVAPGFNDVEELDEVRDVHELALHYDDVLEALNLRQVDIVGHSFGAMIAAELAAHVPDRVGRMVLISPFGLWRDDHPVEDLFCRPYATVDSLLWRGGKASGPLADPANLPNDPVEQVVSVVQAMTSVAKFIWPIPDKGLGRRLHRVKADTLVVAGAEDRFVPAVYADEFARAIRGARREIIPEAEHMVAYERTAEVAELVERHLNASCG
jgi:pimeloyl-ACP methyl ester carboxylesterase